MVRIEWHGLQLLQNSVSLLLGVVMPINHAHYAYLLQPQFFFIPFKVTGFSLKNNQHKQNTIKLINSVG